MDEQLSPMAAESSGTGGVDTVASRTDSSAMPTWVHSIALRHWHAVPVYFQLATQLRDLHEQGVIAAGEQLPQLHRLASWVGVGKKTVRYAVAVLVDDRLLHRRGDDFRFA
ncbi:GntR family transcriptional regulator [Rhodococcus sp. Eu-32]|uniref:GntR family transcriptional regulator n=1 Tax=Rhodococcus sp. Eu-32 TaxID=1017319 RepID=UPI000DF1AC78|nr:GntR family transcriptional regulator [Rhodococcus sp. Eu-32]RRQ28634.1 GntR family transcriptional regulator [Rhodococcus sp. Eu-32]